MTSALKKVMKTSYKIFVVIGLSIVVGLITALPVMLLWNWILPSVTSGMIGKLTVLQAWGLTVLINLLFSHIVK